MEEEEETTFLPIQLAAFATMLLADDHWGMAIAQRMFDEICLAASQCHHICRTEMLSQQHRHSDVGCMLEGTIQSGRNLQCLMWLCQPQRGHMPIPSEPQVVVRL